MLMYVHARKIAGWLLLSTSIILALSCQKQEDAIVGSIVFEACTVAETSTKLGYTAPNGSETLNDSRVQLHWTQGDKIRICGTANVGRKGSESFTWQDYQVGTVTEAEGSGGTQSKAEILCTDPSAPLKWLDPESNTRATMYAVYPSSNSLDLLTDGTFSGYIPGNQQLVRRRSDPSDPAYNTFDAPMQYAYMGAVQSGLPGERISFPFKPAFTAFEFTVCASEAFPEATITSMRLYNAGLTLAGDFTCDISGDVPVVTPEGVGEAIVVDFGEGATATYSSPIVFTVLALGSFHQEVTIQFTGPKIQTRSLTFKASDGTPLGFAGRRRYRFGALSFPTGLNLAGEDIDWNGMLNNGETIDWDNSDLNSREDITWD